MRSSERRASERFPVVIDVVVIVDGSERHAAELRDVGSDGVGLVLTTDKICLEDGASATIEFDASSGIRSPLSGHFRVKPAPVSYRPNTRSAGFCIDPICRSSLEAIMHQCSAASLAPSEEIGFLRAWNMLNVTERAMLKDSLEKIGTISADAAKIVGNLMIDPNCSAIRLLHFMKVFLRVLRANSGVPAFHVLEEAFDVYRIEHSLEDTHKDRLIKYELGSSRLASV